MKFRYPLLTVLLLVGFLFASCNDNPTNLTATEAPSQRQFIWEAMNYWYFWQADVPKLADNREYFGSDKAYHDYLMNEKKFPDTENIFEDLLFSPENFGEGVGKDDFSFFIENYEEFLASRRGESQSFGFEYGLVRLDRDRNELFAYVQYVLDGRPADAAGLERGDIITRIDGTTLTINNYQSLLSNSTIELNLAESSDGVISSTDETIILNSEEITEDPIYISKVIETGSVKVGYLLYNSFQTNSHENLNDVFEKFISERINELVLDLRYNGGGAVITSATLASMISGIGSSEIFAEYTFNQKRSNQGSIIRFQDDLPRYDEDGDPIDPIGINKLSSLDRLFVLTGFSTASASESVINSLMPFMEVTYIWRKTVGKDDASLTLYDNPNNSNNYVPFTSRENANPDHKNAIQPIVLKIRNKNGESNSEGFLPAGDNLIREIDFLLNTGSLPPLGDQNDPLLARALEIITGAPLAKQLDQFEPFDGEFFKDSRSMEQFGKDMYILPSQIK